MKDYINMVEKALFGYLEPRYPHALYEAMGYSLLSGGKRMRPILLLLTCDCLGGDREKALPYACAIEMIHNYSLIHDDLPAMDDDDYRRGQMTSHKVYGDAIAILAGDGLLNMAYEIMADCCFKNFKPGNVAAMKEIAVSAGTRGMVGGQFVDVTSEGKPANEALLDYIHQHKTASLITAALCAGAYLALGVTSPIIISKFREAGRNLGIAFQIKDDLLDIQGNEQKLGKPIKSDEKNEKLTYIKVHGFEKAQKDYYEYSSRTIDILRDIDYETDTLLIEYIESLLEREI